MKIAIIGTGNVGGALTQSLSSAGHTIYLGAREPQGQKAQGLRSESVTVHTIMEAASVADVVILAAVPSATIEIADQIKDVSAGKIVIDAMNSVREKPPGFSNTTSALVSLLTTADIVKCFDTTGAENMKNPHYGQVSADMFIAGDSRKAKKVAEGLAKDIGFEEVYDFGGSDKFDLLEQLALSWINLAIMQGYGREIAFKILKRT